MMQRLVHSADETRALGAALGRSAQPGDVLWLHGDLGAGKTEMTKGVAEGLACVSPVSSPSFALIHEYQGGRLPLYHIDLYRIERLSEALSLGLEELLDRDAVVLVEWGERFPALWPASRVEVRLAARDDETRIVTVTGA